MVKIVEVCDNEPECSRKQVAVAIKDFLLAQVIHPNLCELIEKEFCLGELGDSLALASEVNSFIQLSFSEAGSEPKDEKL